MDSRPNQHGPLNEESFLQRKTALNLPPLLVIPDPLQIYCIYNIYIYMYLSYYIISYIIHIYIYIYIYIHIYIYIWYCNNAPHLAHITEMVDLWGG